MQVKMTKNGARSYTSEEKKEIKEYLIQSLRKGMTFTKALKEIGIDQSTVWDWRQEDTVFQTNIIQAREEGADAQADSLLSAHEDIEDTLKARLFSDNTKWVLERRASQKFGNRLAIDMNNTIDIRGALIDAQARVIKSRESQNAIEVEAIDLSKQKELTTTDEKSVGVDDLEPKSLADLLK